MPLRILLAAIGSSGDVNPVIEVGRALRARGHAVTLATSEVFAGQVAANGLGFERLGTTAQAQALMRDPRLWHPLRGFGCIIEGAVLPMIEPLYRIIERHRGPGLVVAATSLCLGARVAQERLGVPTATVHLQPTVFRSEVDNGTLGPLHFGPGMPRPLRRGLLWAIDALVVDRGVAPALNRFRSGLGLAPTRGIFRSYLNSPDLVLGLFPEWFAERQPDWPAQTCLTGFVLHDGAELAPIPGDAEAFLAAGPAPLLVTPGSAATDRTEFFRAAARACARAGSRAMFVTNFAEQIPAGLPAGVRVFPYLPFSRVLPRCSGIVYHGGIGTLAQAVAAGVPHLVIPNAHDQPDNGRRVELLGLGRCLPLRRFRREEGARALSAILSSEAVARRCRELSPRVGGTQAAEAACLRIEALGGLRSR